MGADGLPEIVRDRGADQVAMRSACLHYFDGDLDRMAAAIQRERTTVHHWLTGRNGCGTEELARVAEATGTTVERLRYGDAIVIDGTVLTPGSREYDRLRGYLDALRRESEASR